MATGIIPIKKGGTELNFRIVDGTTQPTSAKENDIWVNTAEEISSYVFSYDEPSDPVAGMVWISTGNASPVPFSATKENEIIVYPATCLQYVNSTWVSKTAMTYRNGAWADWHYYFFKSGVGKIVPWTGYEGDANQHVTFSDTMISIEGTSSHYRAAATTSMIDLTNINTLHFDASCEHASGITNRFGISKSTPTVTVPTGTYTDSTTSNRTTYNLDVSNVSGNYYIYAWHNVARGNIYVYNVYGE